MQSFDPQALLPLYTAALPAVFATIEDDEDRAFISELYMQHRTLMYKTIVSYFKEDAAVIEEAFGESLIRMCKYCRTLRFIPEEKRSVYLMCIVRSVCNTCMKDKHLHPRQEELSYEELPEDLVDEAADYDLIFSRFHAVELLNSFRKLSPREKELIRLRHIDRLDYNEIAEIMHSTAGAMRIAVMRAKRHLEELAQERKEACDE